MCSKTDKTVSFAMSGCGWLSSFYLGVIDVMKEGKYMTDTSILAGTSGGSLGSLIACSNIPSSDALQLMIDISTDKKFQSNIDVGLRKKLHEILPSDVLDRCNGRLHIVTTKVWPLTNNQLVPQITSRFQSREHLIDVVSASCFIPLWSTPRQFIKNISTDPESYYVDGGVVAWMPPIGDVRVSPFPKSLIFKRIRPHISLPDGKYFTPKLMSWVLSPPPVDIIKELSNEGYKAGKDWIDRKVANQSF